MPKLEFVVGADIVDGQFRPSREVSDAQWWPMDRLPGTGRLKAMLEQVDCLAPGEVGSYWVAWADNR